MGFFKDLNQLSKTSKDLQKQSGIPTGLAGMKHAMSQANQVLGDLQRSGADAQRLLATGVVATGIVGAIRDTGMTVNDHPQVELDLQVTIPGQPAYPVTHRQVISRLHLGNYQPGMPVPLRVDPMDANQVLVVSPA